MYYFLNILIWKLCRSKVKIAICFTISTASCWKTKILSDKYNSDKKQCHRICKCRIHHSVLHLTNLSVNRTFKALFLNITREHYWSFGLFKCVSTLLKLMNAASVRRVLPFHIHDLDLSWDACQYPDTI